MDILAELNGSRHYTLHSHTQFCDGKDVMENFVISAISLGFTHYGFTPHSPLPIDSPCNMSFDNVDVYLAEVTHLRELYGDRIRLYAGMEIDYLNPQWSPSHEYFASLPLDYRIGSVHFIPSQSGDLIDIDGSAERFKINLHTHFRDDLRYVVETFYSHSASMLETGGFDILGHFDKIAQNASACEPGIEDTQWYASLVGSFIDLICKLRPVVEVNTKAYVAHGRIFPAERYLSRLIDANVPLVVNSDAHRPELIDASRDYAFSLIDDITALTL